jgi:hypothetical protein
MTHWKAKERITFNILPTLNYPSFFLVARSRFFVGCVRFGISAVDFSGQQPSQSAFLTERNAHFVSWYSHKWP